MSVNQKLQNYPDNKEAAFHPVLFYTLAIACAWTAWLPLLLQKFRYFELPVPYPVLLFICQTVGAFSPLVSLFLLQRLKNDSDLIKRVFRKIRFSGTPLYWLLLSAAFPVMIAIITAVFYGIFSRAHEIAIFRPEPFDELGWAILLVIPLFFVLALIGSPLGEEPGWRGYIFHGFTGKGQSWKGSGIVAVMWWIWHIPLFLILDVAPNGYSFLEMAGHSLLIDSVFLFTGRNLLAAMLYHQGVNTSFMFFASKTQTIPGLIVLLCIALIVRCLAEKHLKGKLSK